jgi:IPT/TIG domain
MSLFDEATRRLALRRARRRLSPSSFSKPAVARHRLSRGSASRPEPSDGAASPESDQSAVRYRTRPRQDPRPAGSGAHGFVLASASAAKAPVALLLAGIAILALAACRSDPSGPSQATVSLLVAEGDGQFALPGAIADVDLTVRAVDPTRGTGVKDIEITWKTTAGNGASLTVLNARTDGSGLASARVRLGTGEGTYRFEATAASNTGQPAAFEIEAVAVPAIASASPLPAVAGEAVTIDGTGFRIEPAQNVVLFGGLRGTVRSATPTRLVVTVPECVASRDTDLRVALGAVASPPLSIQTAESAVPPVSLQPGQAVRFAPVDLSCVRLAAVAAGARFLVIPQNAASTFSVPMRYQLLANATGLSTGTATLTRPAFAPVDQATRFETLLRLRERAFAPVSGAIPHVESAARTEAAVIPAIGDRRDFNVLTKSGGTTRITAAVRSLSQHAIVYVDVQAPSPGLVDADLAHFDSLFDDPIYSTDTSVFGDPSDVDANQRVIILFTPAVNALSERTDAGFIAGYFYGCDLVEKSRCSATNGGEIFYSVVPDPSGQFSGARSKEIVLRTVPAVLAHEFQHMINFARKGQRLDVLWLSEALAHSAEDLVGDVFAARGDSQTATDFRRPNYLRSQYYLQKIRDIAVLSDEPPGSLEQRGGAWLLVKYAMLHYGGTELLGRLTSSAALGAANLAGATGRAWPDLLSDFAVALWADHAPELAGIAVDPLFTFGSFDLRSAVNAPGGYPLAPTIAPFQNFLLTGAYPAFSSDYLMFEANSAQAGLNLSFAGQYGGVFDGTAGPQMTVLRVR